MARPRLPTKIKELKGTQLASRMRPEVEYQFLIDPPPPPILLDKIAQTEWRRVVPMLCAVKVLSSVDFAMLTTYCQAWSIYIQALTEFNKGPKRLFVGPRSHPLIVVMSKAQKEMLVVCREFGMTPSARSRVSPNGQAAEEDPADKYFS